jgi:tetratricopeptide (TPR) repeat protein
MAFRFLIYRALAVLALLCGAYAPVEPQQSATSFADLLRMYRTADAERAITIVAGWDDRRVEREAGSPLAGASGWDSAAHLLLLEEAGVRTTRTWSGGRARRGKIAAEIDRQVEAAKNARLKAFRRDVGLAAWLGVPEIYEEFRDRFPDDPVVQTALGAQMEYEAPLVESQLQNEYSTYWSMDVAHATSHGRLSWKIDQASERLRRALELDPQSLEARLRLGRVLWLLDRGDEAVGEWLSVQRSGAVSTAQPNETYLASLFLGRLYEERGQPAHAETVYRFAISILASGQSARLALTRLLAENTGSSAGTWPAAALPIGPSSADPSLDPWTMYFSRQRGDQVRAQLAELRQRIRQ